MHDLIIKGGKIIDGTGKAAFVGDIAVDNGQISAVGAVKDGASTVIDADGLTVTPGWVDIHTHYDGQVTWDPLLTPSFWHGVTTAVMGNCGVGFAPAAPDKHDWLIKLMEGVEDIPGAALADGMQWGWESFPEYLDVLERDDHAIDVGAQIAHGPVRAYVMGERGANNETATPEDIAQMKAIVGEALNAGALGVSTSRTLLHRAIGGEPVPGTYAAEEELLAFAEAVSEAGHGLLELAHAGVAGEDLLGPDREIAWMRRVSSLTGCPFTFLLGQNNFAPEHWRVMLKECDDAVATGANIRPQVFGRPTNILFTFRGHHPFMRCPSYRPLKDLSFEQRLERLRDPELRAKLIAEDDPTKQGLEGMFANPWVHTYVLGDPPNYAPAPEDRIVTIAEREGRNPREVGYDIMLENDGEGTLMFAIAGYPYGNMDAIRAMVSHPRTVLGATDGGAHVSFLCDASVQTFMLSHWARDAAQDQRLSVEHVVKKQTRDTAELYGLLDRGALLPGLRADINLIDFENLKVGTPRMVFDLPTGAQRIMQRPEGYVASLVAGEVVQENGAETGARPGALIRGKRQAAQMAGE